MKKIFGKRGSGKDFNVLASCLRILCIKNFGIFYIFGFPKLKKAIEYYVCFEVLKK